MVNIAKWIHVPYKIVRTMMPMGFTERFRLHDDNFLGALKDIKIEDIPTTLGGKNEVCFLFLSSITDYFEIFIQENFHIFRM